MSEDIKNQRLAQVFSGMELLSDIDSKIRYLWELVNSFKISLTCENYLEIINQLSKTDLGGDRLRFSEKLREFWGNRGVDISTSKLNHAMIHCLIEILDDWIKLPKKERNDINMDVFSVLVLFYVRPAIFTTSHASAEKLLLNFCEMASVELIDKIGKDLGEPVKGCQDNEIQNILGTQLTKKTGGWKVWKAYQATGVS